MENNFEIEKIETAMKDALAHSLKTRIKYVFRGPGNAGIYLDGKLLVCFDEPCAPKAASAGAAAEFLSAAQRYLETGFESAFAGSDPVLKAFALFDKKLASRTLNALKKENTIKEPLWLAKLFGVRYNLEGALYNDFTY